MTQSPANAPTCAARGAAGRSKRSWLCVVAHVFSFTLSTFSLSTSVVTFIAYQKMAPAVNGTGPAFVEGKFGSTFRLFKDQLSFMQSPSQDAPCGSTRSFPPVLITILRWVNKANQRPIDRSCQNGYYSILVQPNRSGIHNATH
jgi:hypothetical protein